MILKDHDLKQIDEDYLETLECEILLEVSLRLLADLKEARDRLNQTPENSSRPPGSYAPWEKGVVSKGSPIEDVPDKENDETTKNDTDGETTKQESDEKTTKKKKKKKKRNPGKQEGSKGHGRQVTLAVTGTEYHKAAECAACGVELGEEAEFVGRTGLYVLDVEKGETGLEVSHIKHIYGDSACECGHTTRTEPGRCETEEGWDVELTEWHLTGPMLVSLIICLSFRMRLSRPRIQEFLNDWLGIYLSTGVLNKSIAEGGRAVEPVEDQLIEEVQKSELLHIDETGWPENGRLRWLWVIVATNTTLFLMGRRSWDVIADVLEKFAGWLMSDGYMAYRKYAKRLRCWAHLIRKARGLSESVEEEASLFGEKTLACLADFIAGIYRARENPEIDLAEEFAEKLAELKVWCEQHRDSKHKKTRQLARELLNDWDVIWGVLENPDLPITNNVAERALRHWIIARKISYGTRTEQGSRAFTLLASVIETCRQRCVSPWDYLAEVVTERRKGHSVPSLPATIS